MASQTRHQGIERVGILVSLVILAATAADARTVSVRWRWPSPDPGGRPAGFKIYTRHVDQSWGAPLDVGLPPEHEGVYTLSLAVSDTDATYVSVTAYDAQGRESERSNEKLYLLPEPELPAPR